MDLPRPRAVLMDLDGTLTDRARTVEAFAVRFVERFGADLAVDGAAAPASVADVLAPVDGYRDERRVRGPAALRRRLPWRRAPADGVVDAFWSDTFPRCTCPADRLHGVLGALRRCGIALGLVSNGGAKSQRRKLDALGVAPHFAALVISGAVGVRKPDPRIFRLALDGMKLDARDCWFVGNDPVIDVRGARRAGLTPVWVRGDRTWPLGEPAPVQVGRLCDLIPMLSPPG